MPIPIEEFNKGKDTLSLYWFLKRNQSKAFTARELAEKVGFTRGHHISDDLLGLFVFLRELNLLISAGDVEARIVDRPSGAEVYYMFRGKRKK